MRRASTSTSSLRRSCFSRRRGTTPHWGRDLCVGPSSVWSRTRSPRRSCGRNSTPVTPSLSTPKAKRSCSEASTVSTRRRWNRRRRSSSQAPARPSNSRGRLRFRRASPAGRRFRQLGVIAVFGLVLVGCNVNTRVDVVVHDDGSGVLRATVTLDADALARVGARGGAAPPVVVDDLRKAGWTVSPWVKTGRGSQTITISHAFADGAELAELVGELAGPKGILQDPTLRPRRGWFSSRDALSVVVDMRAPTIGVTSDAALVAKLRSVGVDPATLEGQLDSQIRGALHLTVVLHLPGGRTETYVAQNGQMRTVSATAGGTDWDNVVKFGLGVALAVVAAMFLLAARVGASRNRRRVIERFEARPPTDRAPLS